MNEDQTSVQRSEDSVQSDLYEDLLNRYERVLVFAGQLQEKSRQQKLLADQNQSLETEVNRLNRLVDVERSYVRLLEGALEALGVLRQESSESGFDLLDFVDLQGAETTDEEEN